MFFGKDFLREIFLEPMVSWTHLSKADKRSLLRIGGLLSVLGIAIMTSAWVYYLVVRSLDLGSLLLANIAGAASIWEGFAFLLPFLANIINEFTHFYQ